VGGKVGSSAARLVVFLGRSKHNAITLAGRGGRVVNACMQDDHRIHKVHRSNSYCGKRKRARRLSCRASVTRLCEVAAQGGSLTACLSWPPPSRTRTV